MLNFFGTKNGSFCDGVSRRDVMKIGALGFGFGAMSLADLYRLEAASGTENKTKSIINIHLGGGPSHQDMWDLKPEAPTEYRGEFNPIKTNVDGVEICESYIEEFPFYADQPTECAATLNDCIDEWQHEV